MKPRASTLDLIAIEYAESAASGDFDRAEGWFAIAKLAAAREADRSAVPARREGAHLRRWALLPA